MDILLDDKIIIKNGLKEATGDFTTDHLRWFKEGGFIIPKTGQ